MGHYSGGEHPISVYRSKITEQIERQIISEQNRRAGLPELPDPRDRQRRTPRVTLIETAWASPDGTECVLVTYRSNRDAAIRRVARQIIKSNGLLQFGFSLSSASVTPERYLRLRGYRLLPDDEAQS